VIEVAPEPLELPSLNGIIDGLRSIPGNSDASAGVHRFGVEVKDLPELKGLVIENLMKVDTA
jgi:hypothetical protein